MNLADIIERSTACRRLFSLELDDVDKTTMSVWEECDEYFGEDLSGEEVDKLIDWLVVQRSKMPS